jgi:hypothetical protein
MFEKERRISPIATANYARDRIGFPTVLGATVLATIASAFTIQPKQEYVDFPNPQISYLPTEYAYKQNPETRGIIERTPSVPQIPYIANQSGY